ncbi:hypothetical protein FZW96_11235 [Bacillus sp. BGMRC 2118]|nr:hypothetical protein FZW96_11235 [Bacillus sp. BGMRC 2118]
MEEINRVRTFCSDISKYSNDILTIIKSNDNLNIEIEMLKFLCRQYYIESIKSKYIPSNKKAIKYGYDSEPIQIINIQAGTHKTDNKFHSLIDRVYLPKQIFIEGVLIMFFENDNLLGEISSLIIPHDSYILLEKK